MHAYDILVRYPDSYPAFNDPKFVNEVILTTALDLANNPKAMLAEASALYFKFLLTKCLPHVSFVQPSESKSLMQLSFLQHILDLIKARLKTFQLSLIKEGKKEALLHGLLSFFKHLFEDFQLQAALEAERQPWRAFFKDLLGTCIDIAQVCKGLISNNGLMGEDGLGEIQVDCRGHPIKTDGLGEGVEFEDYENLILVGVWLAVKEDGLTLLNFLKWLDFPTSKEDKHAFIGDEDILMLKDSFLDMLFNFKHRGAIEKAAESF